MNGFARPPSLLPPQSIKVTSNEEALRAIIRINQPGIRALMGRVVHAQSFRDVEYLGSHPMHRSTSLERSKEQRWG